MDTKQKTSIEGWVTRDYFTDVTLFTEQPELGPAGLMWLNYDGGECYTLDRKILPDLTLDNSPRKIKLTIEEI